MMKNFGLGAYVPPAGAEKMYVKPVLPYQVNRQTKDEAPSIGGVLHVIGWIAIVISAVVMLVGFSGDGGPVMVATGAGALSAAS